MVRVRSIAAIVTLATFAIVLLLMTPVGAQQFSDRAKQVGSR